MKTGSEGTVALTNGIVEIAVAATYGPRIVRYAFCGGENVLGEAPDAVVRSAYGTWKARGGHRLWLAPESAESFAPDDEPVEVASLSARSLRVTGPVDAAGMRKEITLTLDESGSGATLTHRLWRRKALIPAACWAITILRPGGTALIPQEPFRTWDEDYRAARSYAVWHYTDLSDPRFSFGREYARLRCDASLPEPQKLGAAVRAGWMGYLSGDALFLKSFPYTENASYPDYGSNAEVYTAGDFVEIESLGALTEDEELEHVERWELCGPAHDPRGRLRSIQRGEGINLF